MTIYSSSIDATGILIAWAVSAFVFGVIAAGIWSSKGGSTFLGFLIGAVLQLIGVILVALIRPHPSPRALAADAERYRECPWCREGMRRDASVCPRCQRESPAWIFHEGRWWVGNHYLDARTRQWVQFQPPALAPVPPPPPPPTR